MVSSHERPERPSSRVVPTSDWEEEEELRAAAFKEAYWLAISHRCSLEPETASSPRRVRSLTPFGQDASVNHQNSPLRRDTTILLSPDSLEPHRCSQQDRVSSNIVARESDTSQVAAPKHLSPTHPSSSRSHATSPAVSALDNSAHLEISPDSETDSAESSSNASVIVPEQLVGLQGRSLRNRTAAQLNPYSIEQARYARTLLRNGWQGAVVAGPRAIELSAEEMRRKKLESDRAPKDNLGGWLEFEQAPERRLSPIRSLRTTSSSSSPSSEDGQALLARQALKRRHRSLSTGSLPQKKQRREPRDYTAAYPNNGQRRKQAQAAAGRHRARHRDNHSRQKQARPRAQDTREPRSGADSGTGDASHTSKSSSRRPRRSSTGDISRPRARPSKRLHGLDKSSHVARTAMETEILAMPGRSSSAPPRDMNSPASSSSDRDDDSSDRDSDEVEVIEVSAERRQKRTHLDGRRRRALGMMMPAVFMKRAQADLRLMERERERGEISGSDQGSGDGEEDEHEVAPSRRRQSRIRHGSYDQGRLRANGRFTDEWGDDSPAQSSESEEDSAVMTWLNAFAPRREASTNSDIIDRILSRARQSKLAHPRGKHPSKRVRPRAEARAPLREATNGESMESDRHRTGLKHVAHTSATRPRDVSRPHDLANAEDAPLAAELPMLPTGPKTRHTIDERFHNYVKASHDFGLDRLPLGITCSPSSFVSRGHLHSLLQPPASLGKLYRSVLIGDVSLRSSMTSLELEDALAPLFDAIHEDLTGREIVLMTEATSWEVLRFLGSYLSEVVSKEAEQSQRDRLPRAIVSHLGRLRTRLQAHEDASAPLAVHGMLQVAWYSFDLFTRSVDHCGVDGLKDDQLLSARRLVGSLVSHGLEHTTKSLKAAIASVQDNEASSVISDVSVHAWLGLISYALSVATPARIVDEGILWSMVGEEIELSLGPDARKGFLLGEKLSYAIMTLCAISQLSSTGLSTSTPRLHGSWSLVRTTLDFIVPAQIAQSDATLSSTAIARRDRYIWTLFARCMVLIERWGWQLDSRDDLVPRLFDLLNARRLADLTIEPQHEFAAFFETPTEHQSNSSLDASADTAFHILLKLIVQFDRSLSVRTDSDRQRQLVRLASRLSPVTTGGWTGQSPEIFHDTSILINHYSLYLIFAVLAPRNAAQRIEQARRLIDFSAVDSEARRSCVRAAMYFTRVCASSGDIPGSLVKWLQAIVSNVRKEYFEMEQTIALANDRKQRVQSSHKANVEHLWNRAVLLAMVLRSLQLIFKSSERDVDRSVPRRFPHLALLDRAWIADLLDSSLALDPMLGQELVNTVHAFLDARSDALPRARARSIHDSQDDYGVFDAMDFEDPALDALLGVEPVKNGTSDFFERDKTFARMLESEVSPAFFRLVSRIFSVPASAHSTPMVADRWAFAQDVVNCWARCLTVMVEHDLVEWTSYLRYGNHSWKRISDLVGRRDIALLLGLHIARQDPVLSSTLVSDDLVEIWLQTAIARRLSVQGQYTIALVELEPRLFLLQDVVQPADDSAKTFSSTRVEILSAVFRRMARSFTESRGDQPSKAAILNMLRGMLSAMRDNLSACHDEASRPSYGAFIVTVLDALQLCGANPFDLAPNSILCLCRIKQPLEKMTTIPSRLARLTTTSGSWPVAHSRARALYRSWYRAAPEITQLYALNVPASAIRAKVRQEFERNRHVDDLEAADILLLKGYQEFQETVNCWKMESHVMRWFAAEELPARPDNFLDAFYLSRDDPAAIQPTA